MRLEQFNKPIQERMPASIIKHKQRLANMTDKELANRHGDKDEKTLRQMAWRHGYGNMSSHYWDRVQNARTTGGFREFDKPREKPIVQPKTTMTPKELGDRVEKAKARAFKKPEPFDFSKLWSKEKGVTEYRDVATPRDEAHYREMMKTLQDMALDPTTRTDSDLMGEIQRRKMELRNWAEKNLKTEGDGYPGNISGRDKLMFGNKEIDQDSIVYDMQDASDMIFQLHGAKFVDGTDLNDQELEALEATDELQDWVRIDHATSGPDAPDDYPFEEDESDEDKIKQWAEKYRQYKNLEDDDLIKALYDYAFDLGITQFIFEISELQAAERELGKKQEDWEDTEINAAMEMSPISDGLLDELYKLIPEGDLEDKLTKIRPIIAGARGDESVDEGFIGKKPEYTDFLQNKLDQAIQEYDTPEKKAERDALMKQYLAKGGSVEKVPAGVKAYKGKELKPAFKKHPGTPHTSPMSDESAVKESPIEQDRDNPVAKPYVDMPEWKALHDMDDKIVRAYIKHKEIKEDGPPFGSGMSLVQRALMNKWITAEEWYHLKDKWNNAADEIEQRYNDWPEGEGFGSSDHNFAIKELMGLVGYEFDEQDRGGKFIVTKVPDELEKAGITNVRMRAGDNMESTIKEKEGAYKGDHAKIMMAIQNLKEMIVNAKMGDDEKTSALTSLDQVQQDVATLYDSVDANGVQPVDLKRMGASEPKIYVHKDGKTILIPKRKHNEYIAKGWKQSALRAETSYESKLAEMLKQRLK